jgi:hypothetical protein
MGIPLVLVTSVSSKQETFFKQSQSSDDVLYCKQFVLQIHGFSFENLIK